MEPSNQKLFTVTDSSSTMPAQLSECASTLKSHLNQAILLYRTELIIQKTSSCPQEEEISEIIDALYRKNHTVDPTSKNWEEDFNSILDKMKRQIYNPLIRKFYDYGLNLSYSDTEPHWSKCNQVVASFIFEYFEETPDAITLLQDVSLNHFNRLTTPERQALLNQRHQSSSHPADQGPISLEVDDLWYPDVPSPTDAALFTIQPSSKKARHDPKPSATDTAAALFQCDFEYFAASESPSITVPLDDPFTPVNPSRKRKLE